MKGLDTLGRREREVINERRDHGYRVARLERYGGDLEVHLRALLARLLPGVQGDIDLAAFVDQYATHPLGRGDRRPGLPTTPDLFRAGLKALADRGFATADFREQDALIRRMRHGDADEELALPAREFVDRLLVHALAGYLAHPDTWARIGFNGPAYPGGYAWLAPGATKRRHEGFMGATRL